MSILQNLSDVLEDELKDLYSAETQLVRAFPMLIDAAVHEELKEALAAHLMETEGQVERLERIAEVFGINLTGKVCRAMKGIIEECLDHLRVEVKPAKLRDVLIISVAQRIEHYEVSGYTSARLLAEALGEGEIAAILQETLEEEFASSEKLALLNEELVLPALAGEGLKEDGRAASPGWKPGPPAAALSRR